LRLPKRPVLAEACPPRVLAGQGLKTAPTNGFRGVFIVASSLLALLDDIATILDDVAVLSKVAAKKTAGVLATTSPSTRSR
jgi:hypothetical protein